jgi:hypothetical protein
MPDLTNKKDEISEVDKSAMVVVLEIKFEE